jgi:hypothetical protein
VSTFRLTPFSEIEAPFLAGRYFKPVYGADSLSQSDRRPNAALRRVLSLSGSGLR